MGVEGLGYNFHLLIVRVLLNNIRRIDTFTLELPLDICLLPDNFLRDLFLGFRDSRDQLFEVNEL